MGGFTDPLFLLFAGTAWIGTALWTYAVTSLFIERQTPFSTRSKYNHFVEIVFQVSILPFLVIWMLLAPVVAGYGVTLITLEGIIGIVGSVIIIFFMGANMMKKEHFQIPDLDSNDTERDSSDSHQYQI